MTRFQLADSAKAPWTRTMTGCSVVVMSSPFWRSGRPRVPRWPGRRRRLPRSACGRRPRPRRAACPPGSQGSDQAAVDDEVRAGDVAGALAGEQDDEVGDLVRAGEPAGDRVGGGLLRHRVRLAAVVA